MTEEGRRKAIARELELADEALREAEVLQDAGLIRGGLSRLYFSALHCSRALLASSGLEAKTHRGVKSLLWTELVQPGTLEPEYQQTVSRLETWRDEADYESGFVADPELLAKELVAARRYRERVLALLGP